jgi:uncharacterized protein YyaL (SSP411 family)
MSQALEDHLRMHVFVILRGEQQAIENWRGDLQRAWLPLVSIIAVPADARDLPSALAAKATDGDAVAYLCRGSTCLAPLHDLAAVRAALHAIEPSPP